MKQIPYTKMVSPVIHSFNFPYSPDDGQTLRMDWQRDTLTTKMKLPKIMHPLKRSDWQWHHIILPIPCKILQRVNKPGSKVRRPSLRYIQLKGGLTLPFLQVAWSLPPDRKGVGQANRVLATDLGLINLTTSVICEAGSQISHPIFWSPPKRLVRKIERLYGHIKRLQKKVALYPARWLNQERRVQELKRLYEKINRYRALLLYLTSNHLLETAVNWKCRTIVLEDLCTFTPPKNKQKLSRKLSNWFHGSLYKVLLYKSIRFGLELTRVSAYWTSMYCPRCGAKGHKIVDSCDQIVDPLG